MVAQPKSDDAKNGDRPPQTDSHNGLSSAEAERLLAQYGENAFGEEHQNPLEKFLAYFWGPIPWMIEIAALLSAALRHWADLSIILAMLSSIRASASGRSTKPTTLSLCSSGAWR